MKTLCSVFVSFIVVAILVSGTGFTPKDLMADQLNGAWMYQDNNEEHVLIFVDGYNTQTIYSKAGKKFTETRGGTYTTNGNQLTVLYEFDTKHKEQTGQSLSYNFLVQNNELTLEAREKKINYKRLDEGSAPLAGVWQITGRLQDTKVVPIHRTGTRKTLKILSGTRFQWAAIDPGKKEFSGTGGGTYEFANGKYTEHIEFFSRDSSRVGASLSFDGKIEKGEWHHSGLSSRGERIYEIWGR